MYSEQDNVNLLERKDNVAMISSVEIESYKKYLKIRNTTLFLGAAKVSLQPTPHKEL